MMSNALSVPADACSPDANRDGTGASARLPEWLVHLVALVVRFLLECTLAGRSRRRVTAIPLPDLHRVLPLQFLVQPSVVQHREAEARGFDYRAFTRPSVPSLARRIVQRDPAISRANLATAVVCGDLPEVERRLAADPAAANRKIGPLDWPPSSTLPMPACRDRAPTTR